MTRVGIVTQARSGSTRLPRNVLLEVGGKTLLEHHLDRLATSGLPVLVATTTSPDDDEIAAIASGRGLGVHRGSETDVLAGFQETATAFGLDVIVRVTSDCPLVDGALIATAVEQYVAAEDPWLYLSNTQVRSFPRGFDFEVFGAGPLAMAHAQARKPFEREHVTPFLSDEKNDWVRKQDVVWPEDKSAYRVALDTEEDLTLIRTLIEEYDAASLSVGQIIALLDEHPELVAINADVEQKELGE
ncbi:MAG TPA: glycosyltransferase family protein [Nocardioidaceae bacterium]